MSLDPEKFQGEGLTYDDVLLVPAYSEVMPRDVNIGSKFTRNVAINVPSWLRRVYTAIARLPRINTETKMEMIAFQMSGLNETQIGWVEKSAPKCNTSTYAIKSRGVVTQIQVLENTKE